MVSIFSVCHWRETLLSVGGADCCLLQRRGLHDQPVTEATKQETYGSRVGEQLASGTGHVRGSVTIGFCRLDTPGVLGRN
jgi:hypothetical protein